MKKLILSLLTAAVITAASAGVTASAQSGTDNSVIVRAVGDPVSFNPNITMDDNLYPIAQNLYQRLVKLDASKQIIPDLAEKWEVTDEGKTFTFILRKDSKWSDGTPVTSKDVKYTFEAIKNTPTYVMSTRFKNITSFETPDEFTFVMKSSVPDAAFVSELGWYASFILPEHIYNNGQKWEDNPASKNPVGSGPFILKDFKQGVSVTLVPNPHYFYQPKISQLVYSMIPDDATAVQAFMNGDIDVFENIPAANSQELLAMPEVKLDLNEYPSPMRIIFNMNSEKVKDPAIRKAIATAVNKDEISKKIYMGIQKPEYTMYPEIIKWAANTENVSPSFNTEEAVKILETAGYKKDGNGYYITGLVLDVFDGGGYPDAAKLMEAQLKTAGIEMSINVQEYNAWAEKVGNKKDFIMELQGGFMGPDPSALQRRYGTDQGDNWGAYSNVEFDKLVEEASAVSEEAKRAELYKKAQAILAEDLPFIPIVNSASYDGHSANVINVPIEGTGKWGWAEFTYTERTN